MTFDRRRRHVITLKKVTTFTFIDIFWTSNKYALFKLDKRYAVYEIQTMKKVHTIPRGMFLGYSPAYFCTLEGDNRYCHPVLSKDDRYVIVPGQPGEVKVFDLEKGEFVYIYQHPYESTFY